MVHFVDISTFCHFCGVNLIRSTNLFFYYIPITHILILSSALEITMLVTCIYSAITRRTKFILNKAHPPPFTITLELACTRNSHFKYPSLNTTNFAAGLHSYPSFARGIKAYQHAQYLTLPHWGGAGTSGPYIDFSLRPARLGSGATLC